MDHELLLFDRIEVIKSANQKYDLEKNAYLSFSGGKDSTVLHYLLDVALPGNRIPRVFIDTGIEYQMIREFALKMAEKDDRFVILKPNQPIKPMLEKVGYPFKSKEFSSRVYDYKQNIELIDKYKNMPTEELKEFMLSHKEYEFSLKGKGIFIIYYLHDIRAIRDKNGFIADYQDTTMFAHPKKLDYLFSELNQLHISNKCCHKLKKEPAMKWQRENKRSIVLTGMKREEGGQRANIKGCIITDKKGEVAKFHPLLVVTDEWEDWFIQENKIEISPIYAPPFNFKRTGCKGCPFALDLQEQLEIMAVYLPAERKQCEMIWKPVYDEYRRIGYRLKKFEEIKLF